jgi:nucleotide-binding universal stress UspA family protein
MKKILVPTDFTNLSLLALDAAVEIASQSNAEILLFHSQGLHYLVSSDPFPVTMLPNVDLDLYKYELDEATKKLHKIAEAPIYDGVKITPILSDNYTPLEDVIAEKSLGVDLIVMGSTGADGWKELFSRSNAESVIRNAHCPVLIVKETDKKFKMKRVMVAVDFETRLSYDFIAKLQATKAKITFVYINTPDGFEDSHTTTGKMYKLAEELGIKEVDFLIYNYYSVANGIIACAKDLKSDMIVLTTNSRKGLSLLFAGSVTEDVANHSEIPVLALV